VCVCVWVWVWVYIHMHIVRDSHIQLMYMLLLIRYLRVIYFVTHIAVAVSDTLNVSTRVMVQYLREI